MTIQRTPEDNNLINTLQQTIAIKDAKSKLARSTSFVKRC